MPSIYAKQRAAQAYGEAVRETLYAFYGVRKCEREGASALPARRTLREAETRENTAYENARALGCAVCELAAERREANCAALDDTSLEAGRYLAGILDTTDFDQGTELLIELTREAEAKAVRETCDYASQASMQAHSAWSIADYLLRLKRAGEKQERYRAAGKDTRTYGKTYGGRL